MRPIYIVIAFILTATKTFACGWGPESDVYYFYNLFYQKNISGPEYYPFLRSDDHTFYEQDSVTSLSNQGSLQLWKKLLPKWTTDEINQTLLSPTDEEFQQHWNGKKSGIELSAKQYMQFARQCSDLFMYRVRDSWDYQDILDNEIPDVAPILKEGIKLFNAEKEPALKLRYGYQVIRILHYSKQYQNAVDFFNDKIESRFEKNEMYYYALDQVAGCYYSLEDFEQAAYFYVQVFNQSVDRKKSAFVSYSFCTRQEAEGKSHFQTTDDTIGYIVLKSLRSFSDDLDGIQALMNIAPADEKAELLFMRAINNVERRIWPTHVGMGEKILPYLEDQDKQRVKDLQQIANAAFTNPKISNKDFWMLSGSYLAFLNNDLSQARSKLSPIKSVAFADQKEILSHLYDVFSWHTISGTEEKYLSAILDDVISENAFNNYDLLSPAWKYLILDQVAHLYYTNGQLAKAFLAHNNLEAINAISSLLLIDDLLAFTAKKDKNDFEKILMRRASTMPNNASPKDYLQFVKGLYYLQQGDAKTAYALLNTSSLNSGDSPSEEIYLGDYVSAKIFSNNITECFNCEDTVMVDSVFLSPLFSFIQPAFSKAELALYLTKLDSLTQDAKPWKSKLAHYLLANYYFNVANTGYYRGTLSGQSNCCSYHYFFSEYEHHSVASDLIAHREGYNLSDIADHYKSDNGLAKKAYDHYAEVIAKSDDKELNARCLYMMAKCELNEYYNVATDLPYDGYDGTVDADTKPYKNSFKQLKKEYTDTKFYKMIIRECSFFRYYCSI
jgi:hypothetical protein